VTIYAGCANDAVGELTDVVVGEIRLRGKAMPDDELRQPRIT
jgi:hypothetical protein